MIITVCPNIILFTSYVSRILNLIKPKRLNFCLSMNPIKYFELFKYFTKFIHIQERAVTTTHSGLFLFICRLISYFLFISARHMLAQQRLDDSDGTQISETNSFHWRTDIGSSDQNLYKKRDADIRKSTLLRRLWGNNKSLSEKKSRSIGDWHNSTSKLFPEKNSHSLSSTQSSPEHKKLINRRVVNEEFSATRNSKYSTKYNFEDSVTSPKKQIYKNMEFVNNNKSIGSNKIMSNRQSNYKFSVNSINNSKITSEMECEHYSTRSTDDNTSTTSYATYSDNCDSTFTYSKMSNTTTSTCDTCENNNNNLLQKVNGVSDQKKSSGNLTSTTDDSKYEKYPAVNEATQTSDITNLNIISNVQLSQSTINSIFHHVLNDLNDDKSKNSGDVAQEKISERDDTINNSKLVKVQQIPSFYLKTNDDINVSSDQSRILKYMISNVGTGSNYGKPAEVPQIIVPRYSALPRTSSMEVNTSSGDGTDKESDTLSLVDSLEDPTSPRSNEKLCGNDNRIVRGDISPLLLPDNSKKRKHLKPATFYVPIETDAEAELKPVADHLPAKLKEKLWNRQIKREEKVAKAKSSLFDSMNNHSVMVITNDFNDNATLKQFSDINSNSFKFKSKPMLPSIDRNYKYRINRDKVRTQTNEKNKETVNKSAKRKSEFVSQGQPDDSFKYKVKPGRHLSLRMRHKPDRLTPIYTTRKELSHENVSKKTCNQSETVKRIEILEIVECIQTNAQPLKNKSKIPVLVKPKPTKSQQQSNFAKPCYLDFEQTHLGDPKIDQLIANILIDSLNINQTDVTPPLKSNRISDSKSTEPYFQSSSKQKFDSIPEERSCQIHENSKCSSFEDYSSDKSNDNRVTGDEKEVCNNPPIQTDNASVILNKNENPSTVPKGWITFYMLHKHQGSPDSTSDEGINISQIHQKF